MHQRGGQRGKSRWEAEQKTERMGERQTWLFQTYLGTEKAWHIVVGASRNCHCQGFKNKRPNQIKDRIHGWRRTLAGRMLEKGRPRGTWVLSSSDGWPCTAGDFLPQSGPRVVQFVLPFATMSCHQHSKAISRLQIWLNGTMTDTLRGRYGYETNHPVEWSLPCGSTTQSRLCQHNRRRPTNSCRLLWILLEVEPGSPLPDCHISHRGLATLGCAPCSDG